MTNLINIREATPHYGPRPKVSVIVPALNEERNLPYVAAQMPIDIDEIVFVDGGSKDNTVAVARELWPDAVHIVQTRKGKGNALNCGFAVATGDIIVMIDADGSTDPAEIPQFVGALVSGADFAKGSRFIQGGGSADITKIRRAGNWGLNVLVNALFTTRYTDLCYGYNAFWRRCLESIDLPDVDAAAPQWGDGFEIETLINVRVAATGMSIAEVCSYESHRLHGVSNLNALTDGIRILRDDLSGVPAGQDRGRAPPGRHGTGDRAGTEHRHSGRAEFGPLVRTAESAVGHAAAIRAGTTGTADLRRGRPHLCARSPSMRPTGPQRLT